MILYLNKTTKASEEAYFMTPTQQFRKKDDHIKKFGIILGLLWTVLIALLMIINIEHIAEESHTSAEASARASFEKDVMYRRWASMHGGAYVPLTEKTQPNPYLSHIPDRDIVTQSGVKLTLVNPAYMTRQVYELETKEDHHRGHITSLNPLRPENKADDWETAALQSFENGAQEVVSVENISDIKYLRLMRPMRTEESCLKCHAEQGYNVGDIRGGVSVSVPLEHFDELAWHHMTVALFGFGVTWLLGLGVIGILLLKVNRNIDARDAAMLEKIESDRNYQRMVEGTDNFIIQMDESGKILFANGRLREFVHTALDAGAGMSFFDLVPPDDREKARQQLRDCLVKKKDRATIENSIVGHGELREILWTVNLEYGSDENSTIISCIGKDVTDYNREWRKYQTVLHTSMDGYWIVDGTGRFLEVNDAYLSMMGYKRDELILKYIKDVKTLEGQNVVDERMKKIRERGHLRFESRYIRKDGVYIDAEVSASYMGDEDDIYCVFVRDITERKKAENLLRESEKQFQNLFDKMVEGVVYITAEGQIDKANPAAERILGLSRSEIESRQYDAPEWERVRPDGSPFPMEELATGRAMTEKRPIKNITMGVPQKDGSYNWITVNADPVLNDEGEIQGVVATFNDISDRKQVESEKEELEKQLIHTQKMEAVGLLAGGVAHDFNNILTILSATSDLALMELTEKDRFHSEFTDIYNTTERAAQLTQQLLAFSRKQIIEPRVLNLNATLFDMERMLHRIIGEDIELVFVPEDRLWAVKADPGLLNQVLTNLVVNARDAMKNGGKITIETQNITLDQNYSDSHVGVVAGEYVMMAVSDTGSGMDEETKERVFEPFFTTKKTGEGTGLGLSTCYGIIKQSGGNIWLYSEPGKGTTFKVYLPRNIEPEAESKRDTAIPLPKGIETILLVEDEPVVRKMTKKILTSCDYTVFVASHGGEALQFLEKNETPIDLLLTDVVMPQMGGKELSDKVLEMYPDTKVLFMSGYTDKSIVHHGVLDPGLLFLQKPFTPVKLLMKVREVLDGE